jgi:ammonia channel protein AmtB
MLGIIIGAAILGIIIAVMEKEEFPGWGNMVICVLAAGIPNLILNYALGPDLWFVGLAVGAVCGMVAISATCGMAVKRAAIAMGIYVLVQIALSFAFVAMFR